MLSQARHKEAKPFRKIRSSNSAVFRLAAEDVQTDQVPTSSSHVSGKKESWLKSYGVEKPSYGRSPAEGRRSFWHTRSDSRIGSHVVTIQKRHEVEAELISGNRRALRKLRRSSKEDGSLLCQATSS
ncbi:unnamed protein product [Caenorhabditis nigoni]